MADMPHSRNWFSVMPASRRRAFSTSQRRGRRITLQGGELIDFASNDYLGLSSHPVVREAAVAALADGVGSGASRLISGDDPRLHRLEARLAAWKGYEACLIVGSGMLANLGLIQALADRHTHTFSDRLNHASLVDGVRLAGCRNHRYAHNNLEQLDTLLARHPAARRIIISDGVFSMDGDSCHAAELLALAEAHDALLLIDDAHGIGTIGADGRGLTARQQIQGHERLIEVGTFGKAFGGYGAFILGTRPLIDGLIQRQRTMIYSTALPAVVIAAADAALDLIQQGELVAQLHARLADFKRLAAGLPLMPSDTPIQPLLIGRDEDALRVSQRLREAGVFVPAIRPPTVPQGSARLRITLSAVHTTADIARLVAPLSALTQRGEAGARA